MRSYVKYRDKMVAENPGIPILLVIVFSVLALAASLFAIASLAVWYVWNWAFPGHHMSYFVACAAVVAFTFLTGRFRRG